MTDEDIKRMIDDLDAHASLLPPWEASFLAYVQDTFDRIGKLGPGAQNKLEEIYEKHNR